MEHFAIFFLVLFAEHLRISCGQKEIQTT